MKRISLFLLLGAIAVLLAPQAHGQTPPPATGTPQPTPVATPDPRVLMQQAFANQPAQGAVHWLETDTYNTPRQSREADTTTGDISWRDTLLHQVTTERTTNLRKKPNTTSVTKSTDLIANGILAQRDGKGPWDCSKVDLSGDTSSGSDSGDLSSVLTDTATFTEANLGLETLNGVSVWHLRETMAIPGGTPKGHPGVGDYYITQADELPVREVVSLTMIFPDVWSGSSTKTVRVIQHGVLDYTKYGETFGVTLPSACRGTHTHLAGAGGPWVRWAGFVTRAARFARSQGATLTRR